MTAPKKSAGRKTSRDSGLGAPDKQFACLGHPRNPQKAPALGMTSAKGASAHHSPLTTHHSPVVPLYPYQRRWVEDSSRFKLAVKATQIGYSFAASLEAVLDCLERRTLWIVLSRGERQSLEFMQKVLQHVEAMRIAAGSLETSFFENTEVRELAVKFPNGSRIIGLPANPDTARGYTGNMILDEFAFHQQDREIWAAAFGRVSRGDLKLRVISTPNGQRGKYYELAKQQGLGAGGPLNAPCALNGAPPSPESRIPVFGPGTGATCTPPSPRAAPSMSPCCEAPSATSRAGSRNTSACSSRSATTTFRSI